MQTRQPSIDPLQMVSRGSYRDFEPPRPSIFEEALVERWGLTLLNLA